MKGVRVGRCKLFRTEQQYENAHSAISPCWKMPAYRISCWNPAARRKWSPRLAEVAHKLTGGLQLPNDETGDCQLFTRNLARMAEQAGVKFRFNTPVDQPVLRRRANLRA